MPRRSNSTPWLTAFLIAIVSAACRDDSVKPGPTESGLAAITVSYLCGNDFEIRNQGQQAIAVHYSVVGTAEEGELQLPGQGESNPGALFRLTTIETGPVRLSSGTEQMSAVENRATVCPASSVATQPETTEGRWTAPFPWPIVAVHLHLLPNGKVLSWGRLGQPQVWDPETGGFTEVPSSTMVFCSGHSLLADGRLLVTGGHLDDKRGLPDVNLFDATTQAWTSVQPMSRARWYPTSTTLANGEVLTLGGTDENAEEVEIPEVWTGSGWRSLAGAVRLLHYYPRTFVAPNGLVFYAGEFRQTAYLDPDGTGTWLPVADSRYGRRDYGSAVMYQPGKVMIVGGSDPPDGAPTNTAEVIDLNEALPSWRYTAPMAFARRQFNATLLPDGEVLVTGGTSAAGFSTLSGGVHAAEAWNPRTEQWTLLAQGSVTRVYHSTTLLLPDGRILHTGSGDGPGVPRELSAELYSPPYLFRGPRPEISEVPESVDYGERFSVATPDAGRIVRATLIRLPSVTHGFDQNQRFLDLALRRTLGGLTLTAPARAALAPPGHYMLFLENGAGVPSKAHIIAVG